MDSPNSYNRRNLELRAAEYYVGIRKPEQEWRSVEDLTPQLVEFAHRIQAQDCDVACELLNQIDYDYLFRWGNYKRLVQLRGRLSDCLSAVYLRVMNQDSLGFVLLTMGQAREAIAEFASGLELAKQINALGPKCQLLNHFGDAYRNLGDATQAIKLYEQALEIAEESHLHDLIGIILGNLGNAYHNLGNFDQAVKLYERSLAIHRELHNDRREGAELVSLAATYRALKQHYKALLHYDQALAIADDLDDTLAKSEALGGMGVVYRELGQFIQARNLSQEALNIARSISARRFEGLHLGRLGVISQCLGDFGDARAYYEQAFLIAKEIEDIRYARTWLYYLGTLLRVRGCFEEAVTMHRQTLPVESEDKQRSGRDIHLLGLGKALAAQGRIREAQSYFDEAMSYSTSTQHQVQLMQGIGCLLTQHKTCGVYFSEAVERCVMILKVADLYEARFSLATSLVGQAICHPQWEKIDRRLVLLTLAIDEYSHALNITAAPGVVRDALRDLELIRAAGVEGLEPVFALLEGALNRDTPLAEDAPALITV